MNVNVMNRVSEMVILVLRCASSYVLRSVVLDQSPIDTSSLLISLES